MALSISATLNAQTAFQNLGFDEGAITSQSVFNANVQEFLPGWKLAYNGVEQSTIDVNTLGRFSRDGSAILNRRLSNPLGVPAEALYSLALINGTDENLSPLTWKLSQTGTVPLDAKSLWFKSFDQPVLLRFDDQQGEPVFAGAQGGFSLFAADVRGYAGKTVMLAFNTGPTWQTFGIDSIRFSSEVVPEPKAWLLLGVGLTILSLKRVLRRPQENPGISKL